MAEEQYRANQIVTLSLEEGRIVVDPDPAHILLGGTVTWAINGSVDDRVEIEFDAGGPFRRRPGYPAHDKEKRGKIVRGGKEPSVDSGVAEQTGRFKYVIRWGNVHLDPEVMIQSN